VEARGLFYRGALTPSSRLSPSPSNPV
jgi:hypothetical protein